MSANMKAEAGIGPFWGYSANMLNLVLYFAPQQAHLNLCPCRQNSTEFCAHMFEGITVPHVFVPASMGAKHMY